jgi:ABC-type polysaccharide/polyol phosphate export permease
MKGALLGETYRRFDFTTFYFIGFAPWLLFSDVVTRATTIVRENRNLIRNVNFEHRLLPLAIFASAVVSHLVILSICVGLIRLKGYEFSPRFFLLPIYFFALFLITAGIAYVIAAVSPYLHDMSQVVPIVMNLLFFGVPILYTPDLVEQLGNPWVKFALIDFNPLATIIEGYRLSMLDVAVSPSPSGLASLMAFALFIFWGGSRVYAHLERGFADVL